MFPKSFKSSASSGDGDNVVRYSTLNLASEGCRYTCWSSKLKKIVTFVISFHACIPYNVFISLRLNIVPEKKSVSGSFKCSSIFEKTKSISSASTVETVLRQNRKDVLKRFLFEEKIEKFAC